MSKKLLFIIFAIIIVIAGLVWVGVAKQNSKSSSATSSASPNTTSTTTETTPSPASSTQQVSDCQTTATPEITYDNGSFSPKCIKVKSGTTVTWKNNGSDPIQIGANPHPSHTGNREVSNNQYTLTVDAGKTATSTLTTKGQHGYHNHLNPTSTGVIIVE